MTTGQRHKDLARAQAKDHAEKRQAILATAAEFFADNGYDRSSMNQLATACGVSKALIYHYYDSKEALLFDIVKSHLMLLEQTVLSVDQTGVDKPANLRATIKSVLLAYRDSDAQHKVQTDAMTLLPDAQRESLAEIQRRIVAVMAQALRAVSPEKYDTAPETLTPLTMSIFGMLNWFYMWHRPGGGISREEYADMITDLVLHGVADGRS